MGSAALLLAACAPRVPALRAGPSRDVDEWATAPDPGYDAWVLSFLPRARNAGIPEPTLQAAFAEAGFIPAVIEKDRSQAEFSRSLQDYLLSGVSDSRVENGRAAMARHAQTLAAVEATYGVDKEAVAAIWGMESSYGVRKGDVPIVSALSTLAYEGRRAQFFETQLVSALRILAAGDTTPRAMKGSWAGAMGHTQFIPTSFESLAVDFTGDGRRDIWGEDPSDALASTANYLAKSGWRRGEPWGELAQGASGGGSGGRVIQPDGAPAFRVYRNFDVIKRYNNADSYAIAVGHLSDRLRGGPPLAGLFSSERPLTLPERIELQEGLTALGFDTRGTDGNVGPGTIQAIRAFQASRGLPQTGFAEPSVLQALR
ncbi:Membrane-bound lytic murein transglycosylase B precursor [Rubellimicrobium mesophilum DSM 19309]|uniref:Membrane-bound lytic murein transglycosylase B n=2 Tax=Rubellimicrobium TaxID=295418 RepID=A0A017HNH8_9RHOB|nr:Membrane-bound lytic murein transglycosylase B precursor [Rubellimicrobium mesophilum DSM 19309]